MQTGVHTRAGSIIGKPNSYHKKISYDVVCDIVYDMKTRTYDVLPTTYDVACFSYDVVYYNRMRYRII